MRLNHAMRALSAVAGREVVKFVRQSGRLLSAMARPMLWLLVFAAGSRAILGMSIVPPYETYIEYSVYIIPGLLGIVLLFHGMQSSLSMVYDREMGMMRLLLTAPLPRWYLLLCKLTAGTILSVLQAYAFLLICIGLTYVIPWFEATIPWSGWLYLLPAMAVSSMMLGSLGLLLAAHIRQLENFAGTMNFVIFPMFFISPALYPLWTLLEGGATQLYWLALANPFTHAVEFMRFAAYGKFNGIALIVIVTCGLAFFLAAAISYDPQRGSIRRTPRQG